MTIDVRHGRLVGLGMVDRARPSTRIDRRRRALAAASCPIDSRSAATRLGRFAQRASARTVECDVVAAVISITRVPKCARIDAFLDAVLDVGLDPVLDRLAQRRPRCTIMTRGAVAEEIQRRFGRRVLAADDDDAPAVVAGAARDNSARRAADLRPESPSRFGTSYAPAAMTTVAGDPASMRAPCAAAAT